MCTEIQVQCVQGEHCDSSTSLCVDRLDVPLEEMCPNFKSTTIEISRCSECIEIAQNINQTISYLDHESLKASERVLDFVALNYGQDLNNRDQDASDSDASRGSDIPLEVNEIATLTFSHCEQCFGLQHKIARVIPHLEYRGLVTMEHYLLKFAEAQNKRCPDSPITNNARESDVLLAVRKTQEQAGVAKARLLAAEKRNADLKAKFQLGLELQKAQEQIRDDHDIAMELEKENAEMEDRIATMYSDVGEF